jgi:hypothetical protein
MLWEASYILNFKNGGTRLGSIPIHEIENIASTIKKTKTIFIKTEFKVTG